METKTLDLAGDLCCKDHNRVFVLLLAVPLAQAKPE
jgi:hypothetical protein